MRGMAEYLAELVNAQLSNTKPGPLPENISIEKLMDIAHRNQMNYLILGGLLKADNVSEEDKNRLRVCVLQCVLRNACQVSEIKKIEECFEENKIKCQPMKGARMKFLYPEPQMREMGDIDILVWADSIREAQRKLNELGYSLSQSVKHHDIYKKKPYIVLEMHRAMYDKTVNKVQYEYFLDMSRAKPMEGKSYIYEFSPEDFYVYMMAHMAKHFYVMGCGIRNLVDIYIYLQKYGESMDHEYIQKQLDICGIKKFTEHMETLADIWLGQKTGDDFYDDLFTYMQDCGIYGRDENGIWNRFAEEKKKDKKTTRTDLKWWYIFPPLSYMAEYYPYLDRYPFLLPVTWFVRGVVGIFEKKGVHKRQMLKTIDEDKVKTYQTIYQKMDMHFK